MSFALAATPPVYAFVVVLSHSRGAAVIWSERMDQLAWHQAHSEAFRCLGHIPAVVRIDNLQPGVADGAGPSGRPSQRSLARLRLPTPTDHSGHVPSLT